MHERYVREATGVLDMWFRSLESINRRLTCRAQNAGPNCISQIKSGQYGECESQKAQTLHVHDVWLRAHLCRIPKFVARVSRYAADYAPCVASMRMRCDMPRWAGIACLSHHPRTFLRLVPSSDFSERQAEALRSVVNMGSDFIGGCQAGNGSIMSS